MGPVWRPRTLKMSGRVEYPRRQNQQHQKNYKHGTQGKELAIDLEQYRDKNVQVKLVGGRQVTGILKGFDQLLNLVLDNSIETIKKFDEPETFRSLGLLVCRGPSVLVISPSDGSSEIENPFVSHEE